jgi:hypothetical protein
MAFGNATFSDIGTAVSDIFAAQGDVLKAKGAEFEQKSYLEAADLAKQNEQFTEMSTAIKESQADRNLYQALGQTKADVAGAGFAQSGSALDILRESASEGAMTKAVLGEQGLITEAGYKEQAQSYTDMASAAGRGLKTPDRHLPPTAQAGTSMTNSRNTTNPLGFPPWLAVVFHQHKETKLCRNPH